MKSDKTDSQYDPGSIEPKWQKIWLETKVYEPDLEAAKKPFDKAPASAKVFDPEAQTRRASAGRHGKPFYNLMMFPYPSFEGLHVGNMYAFTGSDIYGRFKRMSGFDVFEPIGLDGFGIHSENYALKIGQHPMEVAKRTEANFYRQLHAIGNAYSWSNKLETYKSNYYKWTQWIFIQLFKAGLAYRAKSVVNWCPHCLTVLADEQVVSRRSGNQATGQLGKSNPNSPIAQESNSPVYVCERCGTVVEKKELEQWFFKITDYADRLLEGLTRIDWSEKVKIAQRNWLGKSEGLEILFPCDIEKNTLIPVFTTRADTIFGVTFLALAPEHPQVTTIVGRSNELLRKEIARYVSDSLKKSEEERIGQVKQAVKTGIDTGFQATNPINGKKVPIYIADYVLATYGSGAVMGVPAHDQRDFEFAKKFGLEIIPVIVPAGHVTGPVTTFPPASARSSQISKGGQKDNVELRAVGSPSSRATRSKWHFSQKAFTDYGVLVNSEKFTGLSSQQGIQSITKYLQMHHLASVKAIWHLRDWIISRQRYWGPPIPMIFCENCAREGKSWFTKFAGPVKSFHPTNARSTNKKSNSISKPDVSETTTLRVGGVPSTFATRKLSNENLKLKIKNSAQWAAGWYPVPEKDLPVELPYIKNFKPTHSTLRQAQGSGQAGLGPLARHPEFYRVGCPGCGGQARRETDVSDTFLDSAWYYLRYPSVNVNSKLEIRGLVSRKLEIVNGRKGTLPWDRKITQRWLPVDMYIGGAEHAVLHLLYSRFLWKVFYDLGYFDFSAKSPRGHLGGPAKMSASGWDEPFTKFRAHGLLISKGAKMSKSKGNVVTPDHYTEKYGSDTLRCYLMFCGRFTQGGDFRDSGIEGMRRFLNRVWRLVLVAGPVSRFLPTNARSTLKMNRRESKSNSEKTTTLRVSGNPSTTATRLAIDDLHLMHKTIKRVTEDIESLDYNTAIAALMEWVNSLEERSVDSSQLTVHSKAMSVNREPITVNEVETLLKLLAPFAPHMCEELWSRLQATKVSKVSKATKGIRKATSATFDTSVTFGTFDSIHLASWPKYDPKLAVAQKVVLVVEVNGKVRDKVEVERGIDQSEAEALALKSERVTNYLDGKKLKRVIFIPNKLINFVI